MALVCGRNETKRKAYTRKAYTREDGTKVKGTRVPATCIPERGRHYKPGEKRVKIVKHLRKGELTEFGYHASGTAVSRHRALGKAIREYGYLSVFRKVNLLATLQKNTSPTNSAKFKADAGWIRRTYIE